MIATLVLVILLWSLRRKIRVAIEVLEESSLIMAKMPIMLLFPFASSLAILLLYLWYISLTLILYLSITRYLTHS
jgi:hypothetical protein